MHKLVRSVNFLQPIVQKLPNSILDQIISKISFENVKLNNYSQVFEEFIDPMCEKCFRIN